MRQRPQLFGKTLFVDLMMSTLVVITALLMASNAVEKQKKQEEEASLNPDGLFAVIATWPDDSADDVDLYLRDPAGSVAFFRYSSAGLMHLERDDRGTSTDVVSLNGQEITVSKNEERIIIRGIVPGEYVAGVHLYRHVDSAPVKVSIRLVRLKGSDVDFARKERVLAQDGDEQTAFRFTLKEDRTVTDINELPHRFVDANANKANRRGN